MTKGTKSIKELYTAYKVDRRTLNSWLASIGIILPKRARILSPAQVAALVKNYGDPEE